MHTRIRSSNDRVREFGRLALSAACVLLPLGCGGGGGGGGGDLTVSSFNLDAVRGTFLNEALVFTFSNNVDPASVTNQTIQLRYDASLLDRNGDGQPDDPGNTNAIPEGTFTVNGNIVTFRPKLPSRPNNSDAGIPPTYIMNIGTPPMPTLIGTVTVFIPGFPATNTVRTPTGRPLARDFRSSFVPVTDNPSNVSATSFIDPAPGSAPTLQQLVLPRTLLNVSVDSCVQVRFTEPILPSSVTPTSIFLTAVAPNTGIVTVVPSMPFIIQEGTTSLITLYVGSLDRCSANPNVPLAGGVRYIVNYTNDLKGFGPSNDVQVTGSFPTFTTASVTPGSGSFQEPFDTTDRRDASLSGAKWAPMSNPGHLVATAGGTGDDGPFTPTVDTVINTDTRPGDPNDPTNLPGTFNWSTINIPQRVTVTVTGHNPLHARAASVNINGKLDVSGQAGGNLNPTNTAANTLGGAGGPGGGHGGDGGMDTSTPGNPGPEDGTNGTSGAPDGITGAGLGSAGFVASVPNQDAGGGGGGSYGTPTGSPGVADSGGPGGSTGASYGGATLDPGLGLLLAGAGGGGAGFSVRTSGTAPLREAGTGGGGGGGVLEIISGTDITVETRTTDTTVPVATIKCDGGAGGLVPINSPALFAAAGGGGSGGAILLRAVNNVQVISIAGRGSDRTLVTARGGAGGTVNGTSGPGAGGSGGKGRINFQANGIVTEGAVTQSTVDPQDAGYMLERADPWPLAGNYSFATSTWFDTHHLFPNFSFDRTTDALDDASAFASPEFPQERIVQYLFQGAAEDPANLGQADPNSIRPANGHFTANIDEVDDSRFIRFRVVLFIPPDISNPNPGQVPTVDQLGFVYSFN
ncbi:MAG: hypothetical protein HY292_21845 [Planctomycetes bacterium]|nr:hypothetical protein [Planctomycetota bacterium]